MRSGRGIRCAPVARTDDRRPRRHSVETAAATVVVKSRRAARNGKGATRSLALAQRAVRIKEASPVRCHRSRAESAEPRAGPACNRRQPADCCAALAGAALCSNAPFPPLPDGRRHARRSGLRAPVDAAYDEAQRAGSGAVNQTRGQWRRRQGTARATGASGRPAAQASEAADARPLLERALRIRDADARRPIDQAETLNLLGDQHWCEKPDTTRRAGSTSGRPGGERGVR